MRAEITITINVPDGTDPIIKVNSKTIEALKKTARKRTSSHLPSIGTPASAKAKPLTVAGKTRPTNDSQKPVAKPARNPNYFNGKPKNKIAERKCLQCGHKFVPNTHNHKFDTKKCKDKYNYKQNLEEKKLKPKPKTAIFPRTKKDIATNKQKRMHGSEVTFSKDPFYIEQLQKAHKQHGEPYSRYIADSKL